MSAQEHKEEWLGVGVGGRQGGERSYRPSWRTLPLGSLREDAACRDAQRAGTCCSVMIQPRSAVALTQQDAVATVTAAPPAAAAAAAAAASAGPAFALTSPA